MPRRPSTCTRGKAIRPPRPSCFNTQPWAIAFKNTANEGYVVSAASNHVVKISVDPSTGAAVVQTDPSNTTRVLQIKVGKNPRGIVVNVRTTTRAYVMNYVSRDITVIDLTGSPESVHRRRCGQRRSRSPARSRIRFTSARSSTTLRSASSIRAADRRRPSPGACRTTDGERARRVTRRSAPQRQRGMDLSFRSEANASRSTPTSTRL